FRLGDIVGGLHELDLFLKQDFEQSRYRKAEALRRRGVERKALRKCRVEGLPETGRVLECAQRLFEIELRLDLAGGGAGATLARLLRAIDLRPRRAFDEQPARGDHGRQFAVAEMVEQAEHVAIDRLLPELLARAEVPADADRLDARFDGAAIEGEQAPLAVTENADRWMVLVARKPVDQSESFLHFIAD